MTDRTLRISPRLFAAQPLAVELFGPNARKYTAVPVMAHLLSLSSMVQFDGCGEDEAVAALLVALP